MLQAQLFIDKDELIDSRFVYEFILEFLVKHKIIGATVFQGISGFGPNQHIKYPNSLFSFDEVPIVITFIDEDEKVRTTLVELRRIIKTGFITTHEVTPY